jgi:hypothetical protein
MPEQRVSGDTAAPDGIASLYNDWGEYATDMLQPLARPQMATEPFAVIRNHEGSLDPDRPSPRSPKLRLRRAIGPATEAFAAVQLEDEVVYPIWRSQVGETYCVAASLALMADQAQLADTYATTAGNYDRPPTTTRYIT